MEDYQARASLLQSTELPLTSKPIQVRQERIRKNLQGIITNWDWWNQQAQTFSL